MASVPSEISLVLPPRRDHAPGAGHLPGCRDSRSELSDSRRRLCRSPQLSVRRRFPRYIQPNVLRARSSVRIADKQSDLDGPSPPTHLVHGPLPRRPPSEHPGRLGGQVARLPRDGHASDRDRRRPPIHSRSADRTDSRLLRMARGQVSRRELARHPEHPSARPNLWNRLVLDWLQYDRVFGRPHHDPEGLLRGGSSGRRDGVAGISQDYVAPAAADHPRHRHDDGPLGAQALRHRHRGHEFARRRRRGGRRPRAADVSVLLHHRLQLRGSGRDTLDDLHPRCCARVVPKAPERP